jgi:hypothetical protein
VQAAGSDAEDGAVTPSEPRSRPPSQDRTPRPTPADVGCWLLKTARPLEEVADGWAPGTTASAWRCVRPSYRLGLMRPGERCVLWRSGAAEPGVHALGTVEQAPRQRDDGEPHVLLRLHRLPAPVPRRELMADGVLAGAEVLRMPAGSNPSYLRPEHLEALLHLLHPDDVAAVW